MNGDSRDKPGHRPAVAPTTTDSERLARQRAAAAKVRRLEEHRRVCRELEALAPLAVYYGPRPLRAVPLAQLLAEWWAA